MDSGIPYSHKVLSLAEAIDGMSYGLVKNTTPKVLVATDFYYPHWTGLAQSFLHFLTAVKEQFAIQVWTIQIRPDLPSASQVNNVMVWRSPAMLAMSRAKLSIQYLLDVWRASKQAEVMLVNSPSAHILPLAVIAWLRHLRLIVFHNGDLLLPAGLINRWLERVFDFSTHFACQIATVVATYTEDYEKHSRILSPYLHKFTATGIPLPKVFSLPATQPSQIEMTPAQLSLRQDRLKTIAALRPVGKNKILVGFAGRFVEEKGFDVLFAAIPLVKKSLPNVEFVFAGETDMQYEHFFEKNLPLYKAVKPHINMLGLLDAEGLTAFYRQLDIFVLPSRSDCFALVQAEAALQKVPLVVSDIPGARDLVAHTGYGALFTSGDAYDLAEKIVWTIAHRAQLAPAYSAVEDYFDYAKRARTFAQLLTE